MSEEKNDADIKKLKMVLPYLLNHNRDHIEDIKKWEKAAKTLNFNEIEKDMEDIIRLHEELNGYFESAIEKLGRH